MDTLAQLHEFLDEFKDETSCSSLSKKIMKKLHSDGSSTMIEIRENWFEKEEGSYTSYVLKHVKSELQTRGVCFFGISNDYRSGMQFGHHFVLFLIAGVVYRVEAYSDWLYSKDSVRSPNCVYHTRCVQWDKYEDELSELLDAKDEGRLVSWNRLFNARELSDCSGEFPMDCDIYTCVN